MLNRHELREWTKTILWSLVLFFGLRVAVVEAYHVPTGSMEPTIVPGDRVLGTKFHYWLFEPARGDVAVFKTPERVKAMSEHPSKRLVKRIVAVAGDTVEVRDGSLFVNGARVEEPYLKDRPAYRMPAVVVPEGNVFVLGDNRNNSLDGHVWGFVEKDQLLARAWVKYWPPWHAGTL
ncbi:MAG: signal peptidase I [bacterium]